MSFRVRTPRQRTPTFQLFARCRSALMSSMAAVAACLLIVPEIRLPAQGVTTSSIRGTVSPRDAMIRVENTATGFYVETHARQGWFSVAGLQVGGPYTVHIRRIGFEPQDREGIHLTLAQPLELDVELTRSPTTLEPLSVVAHEPRMATSTTITDSLLHRLPTLNRDMYDFARLAPQISTKVALAIGGISGAGVNVRLNNFLVDGITERASGNSANAARPLDAIKEYQVLLAPFDVRYGDFAGALVNAVTRSGTNEPHASAFVYERNEGLARSGTAVSGAPYQRTQFGFSAAGPLIRDRVHYFIAPEFQRITSPAPGPYVGQPEGASSILPVFPADVSRFERIMRDNYGVDAGSGGAVSIGSPLTNLFARIDAALPKWNSRIVLLGSYGRGDYTQFSRAPPITPDTFTLSSYRFTQANASRLTSAQLHTTLSGNSYNALTIAYRSGGFENQPDVRSPLVRVLLPRVGGGSAVLKAGSQEGSEVFQRSRALTLSEQLTLTVSASHELLVGGQAEMLQLGRGGVNGSYGTWTFSSLDALERGIANRYQVTRDFGSAGLGMRAAQYALFASDEWRAAPHLTVTFGLRGDLFDVLDHAAYNAEVDALFGRRTDRGPAARAQFSPRLGLTWDLFGTGRDVIRGGVGIFTGRYPPAWAHTSIYSDGTGVGVLRCGTIAGSVGPTPVFVPDYRSAPAACANGSTLASAPAGDVDLLDRHLRMAQTVRGSLAYERRLPWELTATVEGMLTRNISDFVFVNLNLAGPQGEDRHGRVMYGMVSATGSATPTTISNFSEVIDLRNVSANHAFQLSARLERRFASGLGALASYTYTRVRDAALPIRSGMRGTVNWSSQRVVSGRQDDFPVGVSSYDLPHRVVLAGTFSSPWRRLTTDISLYLVGESGSPFTWVAGGDLNADGASGNDPIYVPTRASDTTQIRFIADTPGGDVGQQQAFERFIDGTPCLRRQRGEIMRRNSCREPWSFTSIASVRQSLPLIGRHAVALQLDIFNVLNLLSSRWGHYLVASPTPGTSPVLLSQVGQTSGTLDVAQPIFRFAETAPKWATLATESAYQLQLALRYAF